MEREIRVVPVTDVEFRKDGDRLKFRGYAAVFDQLSEPLFGFREKVASGAFQNSIQNGDIRMLYNHNPDLLLARSKKGKGTLQLREDGHGLKVEADMAPTSYAQDLSVIMQRGDLDQMSFGFEMLREGWESESRDSEPVRTLKEVRLWDVSPVTFPAYPQTTAEVRAHVLALESRRAIPAHGSATSDSSWDGPANEARLTNDAGAATFRRAFAWADPEGDPDTKEAYRFIHHEISADGGVGPANIIACRTGIAVLNGARQGTTIPDADAAGVWRHLAGHMRAGGEEPPELNERSAALTLDEALFFLTTSVGLDEERAGKVLSSTNKQLIQDAIERLQKLVAVSEPDEEKNSLTLVAAKRQLELWKHRIVAA